MSLKTRSTAKERGGHGERTKQKPCGRHVLIFHLRAPCVLCGHIPWK